MEETLNSSLNAGEEILWRGHAESFETLDKTNKPGFVRNALIGGLIALAFTVFMIIAGGLESKTFVMVIVVALLCAIPTINILSDASKLRKTEYIATSERLIVHRDAVRAVYYSQIRTGAFKEDGDGHVSLLCGPDALKAKQRKYREICVVGANSTDSGTECERFCFYAPADRAGLQKVLHEKVPSIF